MPKVVITDCDYVTEGDYVVQIFEGSNISYVFEKGGVLVVGEKRHYYAASPKKVTWNPKIGKQLSGPLPYLVQEETFKNGKNVVINHF